MDHEILFQLTAIDKNDNEEVKDFDVRLQQILQKVQPMLTQHDLQVQPNNIRYQYICTIIHVLQNIKTSSSANDGSLFSVKQFQALRVSIELITAMGILPGLLPGVGVGMAKLCPRATQLPEERLAVLKKYDRLQFSVRSLMELYGEVTFRPVIFAQIGPLLAALLQLCYAPLIHPNASKPSGTEFKMTEDLYRKLKKDQQDFTRLLKKLLSECPVSITLKELMVILGMPGAPSWLHSRTRQHLVELIMQPKGVISLITAVCDDVIDLGEHWSKLDTVSRLIAVSPPKQSDKYYRSICPQLLDILTSAQIKHAATVANCCIVALYEYNRDVCIKNILDVICDPLNASCVSKSENEVERCIESLTKCFITVEARFKHLPSRFLMKIALPLFSLYNSVRESACALKSKIKQLILCILHEESLRDDLFAEFLGHGSTKDFGKRLASEFGPTGGIKITGVDETLCCEDFADTLFDVASSSTQLLNELFNYLLKYLAHFMLSKHKEQDKNLLQTEDDAVDKIGKQLAAVKLVSSLANITAVQEAQLEKPGLLFCFVQTLFDQYFKNKSRVSKEDDCEVLYIGLMLIKLTISEKKQALDWTVFKDFVEFLEKSRSKLPKQLASLTKELIDLIKVQGSSKQKRYEDLSVDRKPSDKFEEALKDLTDPLLPVRAHGLMTLTKLIEKADPCVASRKEIILQLFKENLKHEDSFIYLTAINGLCAFATAYPQVVIETLLQEFIDMPQRISIGTLTADTRMKLGEILVKVTRGLGEMAAAYKDLLVNGFLCATRDPDSLVRASSLSCLGELCKVLGFRLGDTVLEVIYCITCIIKSDKAPECRRAAVMTSTLLLRGLGKDTLTNLGEDLVDLYRGLKYLRDNDQDQVLRLHAHLALEELDFIVRDFLFSPPKLEKKILLLNSL